MPAGARAVTPTPMPDQRAFIASVGAWRLLGVSVQGTDFLLWVWRKKASVAALPTLVPPPLRAPSGRPPKPAPNSPLSSFLVFLAGLVCAGALGWRRFARLGAAAKRWQVCAEASAEEFERERLRYAISGAQADRQSERIAVLEAELAQQRTKAQARGAARRSSETSADRARLQRAASRWQAQRRDWALEAEVSRRDCSRFLAPRWDAPSGRAAAG